MAQPAAITTSQPPAGAATNLADIRPLKPAVAVPGGWEWLWWVLGALVLLGLVWGLVIYLRRRRVAAPPPAPPEPPHVRARRRIEAATALLSDARLFCAAVSDALRWYLEERFELRAPERTTDEFLGDLQHTTRLNEAQKRGLAEFLQECDLAKFARHEPTEQNLRQLQEAALRLVDETALESLAETAAAGAPPASPEPRAA